jgi:peptidoglycan-N-acetylglucosamine deacetylase
MLASAPVHGGRLQDPANENGASGARPSAIRQVARRSMAAALPRRLFMISGPASSGSLAVTFDDGPSPEHTPAVLDRLRALGIRATFFLVGSRAEAHPGLVARIASEGHEIGHHSWSHAPPAGTSAATLVAEARRTSILLHGIARRSPCLFRPPFGKVSPGQLVGLWALGQTIVLWNRDPKDFALGDVEQVRSWFRTEPLAGGDILLLHDTHAHVAPALDALAGRARELGLSFGTPREWRDA